MSDPGLGCQPGQLPGSSSSKPAWPVSSARQRHVLDTGSQRPHETHSFPKSMGGTSVLSCRVLRGNDPPSHPSMAPGKHWVSTLLILFINEKSSEKIWECQASASTGFAHQTNYFKLLSPCFSINPTCSGTRMEKHNIPFHHKSCFE